MNTALALELFGYLGSFLVLVSMLMTSVVRLRVINLIGSAIFATYAILIHSFPTALLNGCLVGVNIYHLLKLRRSTGRSYEIHPLGAGEGFTAWFVGKYLDDIKRYFPDFSPEHMTDKDGFAVFYEDQAAGILLGARQGESLDVLLDYSTPSFRDCSVGQFLYEQLPAYGVKSLSCETDSPEHVEYLEKMGFTAQGARSYTKQLKA